MYLDYCLECKKAVIPYHVVFTRHNSILIDAEENQFLFDFMREHRRAHNAQFFGI